MWRGGLNKVLVIENEVENLHFVGVVKTVVVHIFSILLK